MNEIGILGVGHLTEHLVAGWMRALESPSITLSVRNVARSKRLAQRYGLPIARDNQDLLDRSRYVLLAVRPDALQDALEGLRWRSDHVLVSAVAGFSIERLQALAGVVTIIRVMPIIAGAVGESPTTIFPFDSDVAAALAPLGPVVPLADEHDFDTANVVACYFGCLYALMHRVQRTVEGSGLAPEVSKRLVTQTTRAAATMARDFHSDPLDRVSREIATPGSYTKLGLDIIRERGGLDCWEEACLAIGKELRRP